MRLRLVKNLIKKDRAKGVYIYRLLNNGKLKKYVNQNGDLCYDLDEFIIRKKSVKRGRPPKNATFIDNRRSKNEK